MDDRCKELQQADRVPALVALELPGTIGYQLSTVNSPGVSSSDFFAIAPA